MVIRAVEHDDVGVGALERTGGVQTAESAADDHDARAPLLHPPIGSNRTLVAHCAGMARSPSATRPSSHRALTVMSSTSTMSSTLYAAPVPNESERTCARISTEIGRLPCVYSTTLATN